MAKVCIAIATHKRPRMLERALQSIASLSTAHDVFVRVADNDAELQEGLDLTETLRQKGYRFDLQAILVPERGISQVRNALVGAAFERGCADVIVFVDDDQWVEPDWLDALLAVQADTGADVVGSNVLPDFEAPPPSWALQSAAYRNHYPNRNGRVLIVYGTNGTLISAKAAEKEPLPWFDPSFGLTGGGDAELFHRLRAAGASFAVAEKAVIHEVYPASRVNLRWALQRSFRIGMSDTRILLVHNGLSATLRRQVPLIIGAFGLSPILLAINIGRTRSQVDALCKCARAFGKTAALLGYRFHEYAVTHGR